MSKQTTSVPPVVFNIRFLLRRAKVPADRWAHELSRRTRTGISVNRAKEIISAQGKEISEPEMSLIADTFSRDAEELRVGCLYSDGPESLRKENLIFLLNTLPRGGRKTLAAKLGIRQSTITRWDSESKVPETKNIEGLLKYLGLGPDLDLTVEPLFLSLSPVGGFQQRKWLMERLAALPEEEITRFFPALEVLLGANDKN